MFSRCLPRSLVAAWFGWFCVAHRGVFPLVDGSLVDDTGGRYTATVAGDDAHHLVSLLHGFFLRPIVSGSHLFAAGMLGEYTCANIPHSAFRWFDSGYMFMSVYGGFLL